MLIKCNPCTKFSINQVKGSKDIDRTRLGLQTDIPTDRPTDRQLENNMPPFSRGHKNRKSLIFNVFNLYPDLFLKLVIAQLCIVLID